MSIHDHIIACRSGCLIDDLRFCPAVPEQWAADYRERAAQNPEGHAGFVQRIIHDRITGSTGNDSK